MSAPPFQQDQQSFPTLTSDQIARVAAHGKTRATERGEILGESGKQISRFFVVKKGTIDAVRVFGDGETTVTSLREGQFTGEVTMLSGRRALVTLRVGDPGEVIEVDRDELLSLVQLDQELSEIFVRAFLLRRAALIAGGLGDVVLVGSNHSSDTLRIKEFLSRNAHPYATMDPDTDPDVQHVLDQFKFSIDEIPVLICRGITVLRNPTNHAIADCLGFNEEIDPQHVRDVVIIGAGPAGLRPLCTPRPRGLMFSCSKQMCLAVRRDRARASRTISASPKD